MALSNTPWKIRVPHRRRCWKICRSWSQQKHSKKIRSDEVALMSRFCQRNKTAPRHTAARIRRLPQQISMDCEKKVWWRMWAYNTLTCWLRGIIASVERYLWNLRYSESIIEGRLTVELFERHLFKRISQFWDETVDQFVCRLRHLTASCDFAEGIWG